MSNSPTPAPRRRGLLAAGLLAFALGTSALTTLPFAGNAQPSPTPGAAITLPRQAGPEGFGDLAARVAPAVVRVTVTGRAQAAAATEVPPQLRGTPLEDFFRRFEGQQRPGPRPPQGRRSMGQGSGFIIDPAGYIVTNNHVVGEASTVRVELADGRELEARVVGRDPQTDLAVLKVEAGGTLPSLSWGDSDALRVGDWVVAMGNPFGLGGSVTAGIVSARGRQIGAGPYDDFIQTDAPINPGNSGGPLFNANGEVVGINTAIYAPSGGNVGIGFAVPARMARNVIADLQRDGVVARGWLGVSMQPIDSELASALNLPNQQGALVAGVEPRSPAARAGLRSGDVVVRLGDREIASPRDLAIAVAEQQPQSEAAITVLRDGERVQRQVTIGLREQPQQQAGARQGGSGQAGAEAAPATLGLRLMPRKGEGAGVQVAEVQPGSLAASRGLRPGDVILRIGGQEVRNPRDVTEALGAARRAGREAVAFQIDREGGRAFVAVPLREQG
ncbi:DegQ family serine endoprotease [Falsiroseomonas selenitidurans]|uniref:Probable periplasmic serine endoprotease DegP-like n=1 Tax=Falsiroseomonas selenitidurans TaxID=2716335 RepID=A0ABX1E4A4_9PROT|nr:DegQ family serine endoprotease [Falsiroseomonas selenitidurans]NKC32004.1 DegQ family serine endoprotease [Falsiroseomonas selenitidurans]